MVTPVESKPNEKVRLIPRIEFRVCLVSADGQHELPLGVEHEGEWIPYRFAEGGPEGSLVLNRQQLVNWLANPHGFGCPFLDELEAEDVITETAAALRKKIAATGDPAA